MLDTCGRVGSDEQTANGGANDGGNVVDCAVLLVPQGATIRFCPIVVNTAVHNCIICDC